MSLPPQGPPPYGPPPYGTPYGAQPPSWPAGYPQQYRQGPPAGFPAPKKTRGSKAVFGILVAAGLAVATFFGFVVYVSMSDEPVTAYNASSFDAVCEGDWVENAADYGEPYNIIAFYYGLGFSGTDWWSVGPDKWTDSGEFTQINAVACLTRKEGSEVKSRTCEDNDAGARIQVDYYSVDYDVELRAAKTGEVVRSLGVVSGTARSCPVLATYDRRSKKIFARPDEDAVARMLAKFGG